MDYMSIANHWTLWVAGAPLAILSIVIAWIYIKKARGVAKEVGLTKDEVKKSLRAGVTSSIGPSIGVLVVMLGLMAAIGAPFAWMRLTSIGSAPIQLSAAELTAQSMGVTLGGEGYAGIHFAAAAWTLSLNGMSWLLVVGLFADKLDGIQKKVSGGDPKRVGILAGGAMLGAFSYFFVNEFNKGVANADGGYIAALFGAGLLMFGLTKLGEKFPILKEYNLGISMILGMAIGVIWNLMF